MFYILFLGKKAFSGPLGSAMSTNQTGVREFQAYGEEEIEMDSNLSKDATTLLKLTLAVTKGMLLSLIYDLWVISFSSKLRIV